MHVPPRLAASLALIVLVLGGGGAVWLVRFLRRGAVGDACRQPSDCRSERCVSVSAFRPMPVDPGAPEWQQKMARSLNQAMDPLAERSDGLGRYVPIAESYCTEECRSDGDCPSGFACGEGKSYTPTLLGKGFISGSGTPIRLCAKK